MTAAGAKLAAAGVLTLAAWLLRDRGAAGDVELGVPTVNGVYGGYYLTPHVSDPTDTDGAVSTGSLADDPRMAALIAQSNAAIAADDAAQGVP
jgi:hypothetical protein